MGRSMWSHVTLRLVAFVLPVLLGACGQLPGTHEAAQARLAASRQELPAQDDRAVSGTTSAGTTSAGGSDQTANAGSSSNPFQSPIQWPPPQQPRPQLRVTIPPRQTRFSTVTDPTRVTWDQWATMLLRHMKLPTCRENVASIVIWEAAENTQARWNPLATTLPMKGATVFNSHGVRNYKSLEQGIEASAQTLYRGITAHGYGAILDALRRCAEPEVTAAAINASNWCRGCAGGTYVVSLVPAARQAFGLD